MISICIVTSSLNNYGGGATVLRTMITNLNDFGYCVTVILYNELYCGDYLFPHEVELICLNKKSLRAATGSIVNILFARKFEIVFSNNYNVNVVMGIIGMSKLLNTKFIGRESNIMSKVLYDKTENINPMIWNNLIRLSYRGLDAIVVQSADMLDDLIGRMPHLGNRMVKIYNPVNLPSKIKTERNVNDSLLRIICVGRLVEQKKFDDVIEIATALLKNNVSFQLDIYGDGVEKNRLLDLIKNNHLTSNVSLLGVVDDLKDKYVDYDVFLMTSLYEGFPNSLLEAISCGVPAFVFDCPGDISEIIDENNGVIIPNRNHELMVQYLVEFKSQDNFNPTAMSRKLIDKFGVNRFIADLSYLFRQVLSK